MHIGETRDDFLRSYLETALWSSTDDEEKPLDDNFSTSDFSPESIAQARRECAAFQEANATALEVVPPAPDGDSAEGYAGYLFWLTRCGHGTGFWDHKEWGAEEIEALTAASKRAGERSVYVGDDGQLWIGEG